MATPNNSNINNATAKPGTLGVGVGAAPTPPKSQRGHNKPKCKQCGNVARSRCPYECCKSCCSRNQNPCHIHGSFLILLFSFSHHKETFLFFFATLK
ncbi:hypothetical protein AAZX31_05G066200 [Glycine max]